MSTQRATAIVALCMLVLGCTTSASEHAPVVEETFAVAAPLPRPGEGTINPRLLRRFQPLSEKGFDAPANEAMVDLGHKLFFDVRLSGPSDVSCARCHDVAHGGGDGLANAALPGRPPATRNTPTVLNAAGAFAQFWDGRNASVEELARTVIVSPKVMAMPDPGAVVARLRGIAGYRELFEAAFPGSEEPLTFDNVGRAIGAYERRLSTPGRWDQFLAGDKSALDAKEKEGLRTFLAVGCMVCHTGPLVGGTMFERVGAVEAWPNQKDTGRMAVTHSDADRMMFKVPTLRNVSKTGPYFHDASAATLPEAVRKMGRHQLGIELTPREVDAITSWLTALDGEPPALLATTPELPR